MPPSAHPFPAGQFGASGSKQSWDSSVAVRVVTLASLPGSSRVSPCASGTGEGQGRCVGLHGHCPSVSLAVCLYRSGPVQDEKWHGRGRRFDPRPGPPISPLQI
jgi:hypothetical protein